MKHLVFLLEEPSAKDLLEGLLPRLIREEDEISVRYLVFEGKQDLEGQLIRKLRGGGSQTRRSWSFATKMRPIAALSRSG